MAQTWIKTAVILAKEAVEKLETQKQTIDSRLNHRESIVVFHPFSTVSKAGIHLDLLYGISFAQESALHFQFAAVISKMEITGNPSSAVVK